MSIDGGTSTIPIRLRSRHVSIEKLIGQLRMYAGRPVIDKTGLTGFYDFEMEWMLDGPPNAEPSDPAGSSVFTVCSGSA